MNVERLKAIRDRIQQHPENFNYGTWFYLEEGELSLKLSSDQFQKLQQGLETHSCGTHACVAGHAVLMYSSAEEYIKRMRGLEGITAIAGSLLGLTQDQSMFLFFDCAESIVEDIDDPALVNYLQDRMDVGGDKDEWTMQSALDKLEFLINIGERQ